LTRQRRATPATLLQVAVPFQHVVALGLVLCWIGSLAWFWVGSHVLRVGSTSLLLHNPPSTQADIAEGCTEGEQATSPPASAMQNTAQDQLVHTIL